ncbi:MAG: histidine kinase [Bacteroidota bacterium]
MTTQAKQTQASTPELEKYLKASNDPKDRVTLIGTLLETYLFTDPERANELLLERESVLVQLQDTDLELRHLSQSATLHNLSYRYEQARLCLEKAITLATESGSLLEQTELELERCVSLTNQQELERASRCIDRAEWLMRQMPDEHLQARALCRRGYVYLHTRRHTKAIHAFLQAFNILSYSKRKLNLRDQYCFTLIDSGLGRVYTQMGEYDKAIDAFQRALDRGRQFGLRGRLAWYLANLGNALLNDNQYVKASYYLTEGIATEDENNRSLLASSIANLGFCYIEQRLFEEAETMLSQSETLYFEGGENEYENLATIEFYRARIQAEREDLSQAISHLHEAGKWAEKSESPRVQADVSRQLAELYAETGNYQAAYEAQLVFESHRQAFEAQAEIRHQREIENLMKAEAREREAELLKLQASQLQLRALRAQMNPHFLFNCLNSIQSFISTKDASTASKYLARFAMLMRQSLEYINLEYISLEDEIEFLSNYLDLNCNLRFDGNLTTDIRLDDDLEEDIIGVPTMILQPYVENAVEHGLRGRKHGHVQIDFSPYGQEAIKAIITDDGVGRERVRDMHALDPTRKQHRSRGTEITLRRLSLLQRSSSLPEEEKEPVTITDLYDEDGSPAGTRVEVVIPIRDLSLN